MGVMYDANGRGIDKNNPLPTSQEESKIIQPVDIQARHVYDIQTHAGVSILPNQWNAGQQWIDSHVNGAPHTYLGLVVNMTSGTGMIVSVEYSHDGVNLFAGTSPVYDGTGNNHASTEDIELPTRYFRLSIKNKDATVPKTTTAYARLKA